MPTPSVGRIVHYNDKDTCRAAIITHADDDGILLTVFQVAGPAVQLNPTAEGTTRGTWHGPEQV